MYFKKFPYSGRQGRPSLRYGHPIIGLPQEKPLKNTLSVPKNEECC